MTRRSPKKTAERSKPKPADTSKGTVTSPTQDETATAPASSSLELGGNTTANTAAAAAAVTTSDPHAADAETLPIIAKFPQTTFTTNSSEPVTTVLLHEVTETALLSSPTFLKTPFTHPSPSSPTEWPLIIEDAPGAGKGVFARSDIPLGKLILEERSLLVIPVTPVSSFKSQKESQNIKIFARLSKLRQKLIDSLDDEDRKAFYDLHNHLGASVTQVQGILETNVHDIGPLPGSFKGHYGALGITMSRFNHSCCPNARYVYNADTLSMRIIAIKPIKKGEQILITYIETLLLPRKERQSQLRTEYGFTCACPTCATLPPKESLRSDTLRVFLGIASNEVGDGTFLGKVEKKSYRDDLQFDDYPRKSSQGIIDALDEEGPAHMHAHLAINHFSQLSLSCNVLGDTEGVVKWGRRGLEIMEARRAGWMRNDLDVQEVAILEGWKVYVERLEKTTPNLRSRRLVGHSNSSR